MSSSNPPVNEWESSDPGPNMASYNVYPNQALAGGDYQGKDWTQEPSEPGRRPSRVTEQDQWQTIDVLDQGGDNQSHRAYAKPMPRHSTTQSYASTHLQQQQSSNYGSHGEYVPARRPSYEQTNSVVRPMEDDNYLVVQRHYSTQPSGVSSSSRHSPYAEAPTYQQPRERVMPVSSSAQSLMHPEEGDMRPMPGYKPTYSSYAYQQPPTSHTMMVQGRCPSPPPDSYSRPVHQAVKPEYYRTQAIYTPSPNNAHTSPNSSGIRASNPCAARRKTTDYQKTDSIDSRVMYSDNYSQQSSSSSFVKSESYASFGSYQHQHARIYYGGSMGPPSQKPQGMCESMFSPYDTPPRRVTSSPTLATKPMHPSPAYSQTMQDQHPVSYSSQGADQGYRDQPSKQKMDNYRQYMYGRPPQGSTVAPNPVGMSGSNYNYREYPPYQSYSSAVQSYDNVPSRPSHSPQSRPQRQYMQTIHPPSPTYTHSAPLPSFNCHQDIPPHSHAGVQSAPYPTPNSNFHSPAVHGHPANQMQGEGYRIATYGVDVKPGVIYTAPSTPESLHRDRNYNMHQSSIEDKTVVSSKRSNDNMMEDEEDDDDENVPGSGTCPNANLSDPQHPMNAEERAMMRRRSMKINHFHDLYVAPDIGQHQPYKKPTAKSKRPRMFVPGSFSGLDHLPPYHIIGNAIAEIGLKDKLNKLHIAPDSKSTCKSDGMTKKTEAKAGVVAKQQFQGFIIGQQVEVNNDDTWQRARVRYADDKGVFVHYEGWGVEYDEWVDPARVMGFPYSAVGGTIGPKGVEEDSKWDKIRLIVEVMQGKYSTGIVFDNIMMKHECCCKEPESWHPEQPARISWILESLDQDYLIDRCIKLRPREVTNDELALVHSGKHIQTYGQTPVKLEPETEKMECGGIGVACDTVYNKERSPQAAYYATGSLVEMVTRVLSGELKNGFAVIRPPGHHAEESEALGFCFFNNVSVAATVATQLLGVKRVLIVDWDVHHGNGTQNAFYNSKDVMYISLHRYDDGRFYPFTGAPDECGEGEGEGYNINIAWRGKQGCNNTEYLAAFTHVIIPIAKQFNPELIIVSAGFDAADGDLIGGYSVTPEGYAHMTHQLMQLCDGNIVLSLEGGYDYKALPSSATACMRTLLGEAPPLLPYNKSRGNSARSPTKAAQQCLKNIINIQKKYWPMLEIPKTWEIPSKIFQFGVSDSNRKSTRGK